MQSFGQFERLETKRLLTAVELTTEQVLLDANDFDQYRNATLELADVNADGITDVVVARHATGEFGWVAVSVSEFGWPTAALQPVGVEAGLLDVTVQDFIGDSHVDFLVRTDTSLVLYEQTSNSTFQRHAIWGSNDTIRSLEILDFDFDGQADLAVLNDLDQITILHNNGDGTFTQTDSSRVGFLVGQIDYQSRDTSFLIGNDEQGTVHRHFVNQDGVLSNSGPVVAELSAYSRSPFLLTDFDGDNQVDMLANSQRGLDWLEWNSTKQAFVFSETLIPDRTFESIDVFDFDGDGQLELLLPDSEGYVEYQRSPDESRATSYVRNLSRRFTNYAIADRAHDASGPMLITANGAEDSLIAFDDHGMSREMRAPRISRPAATSNVNSRIIDQDLVIKAVDGGAILYSNFTEGNTIGRIVAPPQPGLRFDRSVIINGVTGLVWFGDGYIRIQRNALEPTLSDKLHGVMVMDTGEFNGDGRTDLLLAEGDRADIESTGLEGTVRMAIQGEDGQWSIQGDLSLWFPEMLDVTARDLNRDGLDDLVRHRWYFSQLYSVRLNTGDGQFDEVREIFNHEYRIGEVDERPALSPIDILDDERLPLQVSDVSGTGFDEWFGERDGAFRRFRFVRGSLVERQVLPGDQLWIRDVNLDGIDDIVMHHEEEFQLYQWDVASNSLAFQQVLPGVGFLHDLDGNGTREFIPGDQLVPLGDYDRNGQIEFLKVDESHISVVSAMAADAMLEVDYQLRPRSNDETGSPLANASIRELVTADLDSDGVEDSVLVTEHGVYWLSGGGLAAGAEWKLVLPAAPESFQFVDLDNDGQLDIVTESRYDVRWSRNLGGEFGALQSISYGCPPPEPPNSVGLTSADYIHVFSQRGPGSPGTVSVFDINCDGVDRFVLWTGRSFGSTENLDEDLYGDLALHNATYYESLVSIGDRYDDGAQDYLFNVRIGDASYVRLSHRERNETSLTLVHEIQTQRSTALLIDLDQDSFQDIVLLQKDRVMVAYGEGAGSFSEVQTLFQVNETFDLSQVIDSTFLDMDYDGDLDLLLFNEQIYFENVDVWSKPAVRHELRFSSPDFNPPDAAKVVIPDTTPEHVRFLAYGDSLAVDLRIEPTYRRLDFNRDGMLDSKDIDRLHAQVASTGSGHRRDMRFDMNHDFFVDQADMARLLDQFGTSYGDVNVDGAFNSDDLVQVFQLGKFRDPGSQGTTTYSQGDWNLDGQFDSDDLVYAFQLGNYVVRGSFDSIPIESRSWTFAEMAEVADRKNRTST